MQASRVVVDQGTHLKNALTAKRRKELRIENVKALIKSKPAGTPIGIKEFQNATGLKSYPGAWAFVDKLVKEGVILRTIVEGKQNNQYALPAEESQVRVLPNGKRAISISNEAIKQQAMRWAWEHDSDSLRGFINSLEK